MDKIRVLEDALTNYLEVVRKRWIELFEKILVNFTSNCKERAAKILEND